MIPLLSICIPTYNRYEYLISNLEILMPQVAKFADKIEVLINDNASTDSTTEILSKVASEKKWLINLKTLRNNVGLHDNFVDVISRASGNYIYLMGDDDLLSPNFIEILLPKIAQNEYSIIHFNRISGNGECTNNFLHDRQFNGSLCEELSIEDFIKRVMSAPNFISSVIFKKEIWDNGEIYDCEDKYFGYEFLAREFWGALKTNSSCLYYYMPLVIMRNPERTWARFGFLYMMVGMYNIFNDLDKKIPGVKEIWAHRIRHTHFYDFHLLLNDLARDRGLYRQYRDNINEICINRKEKFAVKLLLDLPWAKFVAYVYPKLLKLHRLLWHKYRFERRTDF